MIGKDSRKISMPLLLLPPVFPVAVTQAFPVIPKVWSLFKYKQPWASDGISMVGHSHLRWLVSFLRIGLLTREGRVP